MGKTVTGTFVSDGALKDLFLGFDPGYFEATNTGASATEVSQLKWYKDYGDAKEVQVLLEGDQTKKTSGGYVSALGSKGLKKTICTFDDTGGAFEDLITVTDGHGLEEGEAVMFIEDGGLPTNLDEGVKYYAIVKSPTTFQIAATRGSETAVDFGSDGTPTNYYASYDKQEPASEGTAGIRIAAGFMDSGDVIAYTAVESD